MTTKITLTVDETLSVQDCDELQLLLCDAFSEFASRRYPAQQYVDERYPATSEGYNWINRPQKVAQVERRIALAQKLHKAVFEHIIEPEPRAAKRALDEQRAARAHTNHAVCVSANTPCSPACASYWTDSGERVDAGLQLLQDLFGMEEEEARTTYNVLTDKQISKTMVKQGLTTSNPYSEKRRLFEMALSHEAMHHACGTKPDVDTLTRLLKEMFS